MSFLGNDERTCEQEFIEELFEWVSIKGHGRRRALSESQYACSSWGISLRSFKGRGFSEKYTGAIQITRLS